MLLLNFCGYIKKTADACVIQRIFLILIFEIQSCKTDEFLLLFILRYMSLCVCVWLNRNQKKRKKIQSNRLYRISFSVHFSFSLCFDNIIKQWNWIVPVAFFSFKIHSWMANEKISHTHTPWYQMGNNRTETDHHHLFSKKFYPHLEYNNNPNTQWLLLLLLFIILPHTPQIDECVIIKKKKKFRFWFFILFLLLWLLYITIVENK